MIVEDETLVADHLKLLLEEFGYLVCGSEGSGQGALTKIEKEQPHLVLMDIRLEGEMDGIEVARKLWDERGIPTVFLTAYSDQETLDRAVMSNPFGYLVKPVTSEQLKAAVELALHRS
jgi:DNA-binding NarL/FixJ family response regulator